MKKLKLFMAVLLVATMSTMGLVLGGCARRGQYDFTIGILAGAQIPAFAEGSPGFPNRMRELMTEAGYTVRFMYQNAGGDGAVSTTIANTFAAQRVDLIFSLGTGASQAALPIANVAGIPLVYGIITDPVGAGLVTDNSTGSSSALPMDTQIGLLEELLGGELSATRRVAFLYTTDEPNSVASLGRLRAAAPSEDYIVPFGIPANGLDQLSMQLVAINANPNIAAIYIPQDNQITQAAAMQSISDTNRILMGLPIVVADLPIVQLGAVASLSVDFVANGARAAEIAFRILVGGESPRDIPFYAPSAKTLTLYINKTEAAALRPVFQIPQSLIERAEASGRIF